MRIPALPTFGALLEDVGRKELRGITFIMPGDDAERDDLAHLRAALIRAHLDPADVSQNGGVLVRHDYFLGYIMEITQNVFGVTRGTMAFDFIDWDKYATHLVEDNEYVKVTITDGRFANTWFIRH